METPLRFVGIASLICGLLAGFFVLITGLSTLTPNMPLVVAFSLAYMFSGFAGFALFVGLAEVLARLNTLSASSASPSR